MFRKNVGVISIVNIVLWYSAVNTKFLPWANVPWILKDKVCACPSVYVCMYTCAYVYEKCTLCLSLIIYMYMYSVNKINYSEIA